GHHVALEMLETVTLDLRGRDRRSGLERHGGGDGQPEHVVGNTVDAHFRDAGQTRDRVLDSAGCHLLAARLDDRVTPLDEIEQARRVLPEQVACEQPTLATAPASQGARGRVRMIPVTHHYLGPADDELADLSAGDVAAVFVDDGVLRARNRAT